MDDFEPAPLSDPYMILVGLGAAAGLLAGVYWLKVFRAVEPDGLPVSGARNHLGSAALLTAVAMFLMCGVFLLGRLAGRF